MKVFIEGRLESPFGSVNAWTRDGLKLYINNLSKPLPNQLHFQFATGIGINNILQFLLPRLVQIYKYGFRICGSNYNRAHSSKSLLRLDFSAANGKMFHQISKKDLLQITNCSVSSVLFVANV
jgi:hypothetical protein